MQEEAKADPTGSQGLQAGVIGLNQTLAFEKAQRVFQLKLEITTTLPGVPLGHQTMHQGSQQGRAGAVTTGDKHKRRTPMLKKPKRGQQALKSAQP